MANNFTWAADSIYLVLFRSGHWVRILTPSDIPSGLSEVTVQGINGVKNVFPVTNYDTGNNCDVDENDIVYRELITATPTTKPNPYGVVMPIG